MQTKVLILVFYCLGLLNSLLAKSVSYPLSFNVESNLIINNSDSVIFNLSNATLTATYIDIPVYIKSDDVIFAIDFAFQFNMSKLTYSSTISTLEDPTYTFSSFFNTNDLFLRYTALTQESFPNTGSICISKVRFALAAPCTSISTNDFSNFLTILNGYQCPSRMVGLNFAQYIPTANFNYSAPCLNSLVLFKDSSSVLNGSVSSWNWNFGGNVTSCLKNNINTYTVVGAASVTLVVTATSGCTSTIAKSFSIHPIPSASFSYTLDCLKDTVYFTNTSIFPNGTIQSSLWYFGDLTPLSSVTNPAHSYLNSGHYKVKLVVTANTLCTSTVSQTLSLQPTDINHDGITDVNDYLVFVPAYGTSCSE